MTCDVSILIDYPQLLENLTMLSAVLMIPEIPMLLTIRTMNYARSVINFSEQNERITSVGINRE